MNLNICWLNLLSWIFFINPLIVFVIIFNPFYNVNRLFKLGLCFVDLDLFLTFVNLYLFVIFIDFDLFATFVNRNLYLNFIRSSFNLIYLY